MKITLEPTDEFYNGAEMLAGTGPLVLRKWVGETDGGVPVHAFIAAVSPQTHDPEVNAAFARELAERRVFFGEPQEGSA